jgi:NDP-sugar pyrophosphorylase family protein
VCIGGQNLEFVRTLMYGVVAIGNRAMQSQFGSNPTHLSGIVCIGNNAWSNVRSSQTNKSLNNVLVGAYAGLGCTYLRNETIIGSYTGSKISPINGGSNVVIGYNAAANGPGVINTYNTIIGAKSMGETAVNNSCGTSNVLIGDRTKLTSTSSNRNVIVGSRSNASTFSDTVCLGFDVAAQENNSLNLGNITLGPAGSLINNLKIWIDGTPFMIPLHAVV